MKKLLVALLAVSLIGMFLAPLATTSAQAPEMETECTVSQDVVDDYGDTCGGCSGNVWNEGADTENCQPICCVLTTVENVQTWFFWIVLVIALIMLLWGAVQFMTAGGNEDQTATARRTLIYALIGIAVAYFSQLLIDMVVNLLS